MKLIRISAVRYANTYPLIFGLRKSGIELNADIKIDHPAECARKVRDHEADIGLVPVATIKNITGLEIVSNYCIGADGPVKTVLLLSNNNLDEIDTIYLDYRSRSSVALTRILAKEYWKKDFTWKETGSDFDFSHIPENEGLVLIGDQCYELESNYKVRIDLADEWKKFTALPFVFACWVSNIDLDPGFIDSFNKALAYGVNNIAGAVDFYNEISIMPADILSRYLNKNIEFVLDDKKREAMKLFFEYIDKL